MGAIQFKKEPCDLFRTRLKIPSCPQVIGYDAGKNEWVFSGVGQGHGMGLSIERTRQLAKEGYPAARILEVAYLPRKSENK